MTIKTNSLTIYLIKETYTQEESVVTGGLKQKEIDGVGKLFYKSSHSGAPSWMKLFEGYQINELFSSSASALLLVNVQRRYFALTFGPAARHFLQKGTWEERFGLIVTLNSVKKNSLRSIDTKTLESDGIQTRIQSARPLATDNFGIDVEKDLIRSVTGESKSNTKYGKSLSGKDSLRVTLECDLNSLKDFLASFLEQFQCDDYKTAFPWIDALKEINDPLKVAELNKKLLAEINKSEPVKLWLTVPEILDWADHGGFKYSQKKRGSLLDDIHINTLKEYINCKSIELYHLTSNSIYRFSQSNEYQKDLWRVYECLYFEHSSETETCFLTDGKWYSVKNSLVKTVTDYYTNIISTNVEMVTFPDYNHKNENSYNSDLATKNNSLCVDADLIKIEGRSTFEFCDVYTKNRQMIHVKIYSRSSVLSHLFNQGYVSANLLLDKEFRDKINDKLSPDYKIANTSARPNMTIGEYKVIYGIISKSDRSFEIPFFSKLTLMHVGKTLANIGFGVSVVKIQNIKPDKINDDKKNDNFEN